MLTDEHNTNRMGAALTVLSRYEQQDDAFLGQIVIGDETWVNQFTPQAKRKSVEWHYPRCITRPHMFKQSFSTKKFMASVFYDRKDLLFVDFIHQGTTINTDTYYETIQE